MDNAAEVAAVEDVDDLPADLRATVYERVAATMETVDAVLADLDAAELPEADR